MFLKATGRGIHGAPRATAALSRVLRPLSRATLLSLFLKVL